MQSKLVFGEGTPFEFDGSFLYKQYRAMGLCHADAEEAVHDGVGNVILKGRFDPAKGSFQVFASKHVFGQIMDCFKRRQRMRLRTDMDAEASRVAGHLYDAGLEEAADDYGDDIFECRAEAVVSVTDIVECRIRQAAQTGKIRAILEAAFPRIREFVRSKVHMQCRMRNERYYQVMAYRYCDSLQYKDIARRMELKSKQSAHSLHNAALAELQRLFNESPVFYERVQQILGGEKEFLPARGNVKIDLSIVR